MHALEESELSTSGWSTYLCIQTEPDCSPAFLGAATTGEVHGETICHEVVCQRFSPANSHPVSAHVHANLLANLYEERNI